MKNILNIFFVVLGVVFFILILLATYLFMTDAWGLKSLLFSGDAGLERPASEEQSLDKNPMLNESQEAMLETFGVDPASVPSEITPAQEACFVEKLGASRVEEIKAGDTPSALEFFKAKDCVE